ncbi:hypothetical protein L873DRAFT_1102864 [Choiromyces venosus 120613-1]|uniref:Uncharacterized protein n=1 Tax=Choiromyces venosus 120613-1 TaxID=1336337 RepID=A0A3N4JHD9_9PEZI|nr:hypothetical protein L873DRAFT_1102864 [Choiromyces venosus 120613-1]
MVLILCSHAHKPIPSKHLSEWTRRRVYGLHERAMPLREISNYLNTPLTTVHETMAKGDQEGEGEREGGGRYPKTSQAQYDIINEEPLKNHDTTCKNIAKKIAPEVSKRTIRYGLVERNLKKWLAQERVHLDEQESHQDVPSLSFPCWSPLATIS